MTFANVPDFESPADSNQDNEYLVTVEARDDNFNTISLEVTVTVTNSTGTEEPTITTTSRPVLTYQENGTGTVYTFSARDPQARPLTWSVIGTDAGEFDITSDSRGRGVLTFRSPPDFEIPTDSNQDNVYEITVVVTDDQDLTDSFDVTITVTNHAEGVEPTISTRRPPTTYRENGASTVYTFRATDPQRQTITWSLEGTDRGDFTITRDSSGRGLLTFNNPPDFENPVDSDQENDYELTVAADDGDNNYDRLSFTITVTDVNEGPEVTSGGDSFTVRENQEWQGATFTASDPEGGDVTRWNLGGRDGSDFTISENGVMTFRNVPDYERPDDGDRDNMYEVEVRPYDGRYYGSHDVTVMVEDVSEITGPATLNRSENFEGILATYTAAGQGDLTVAPSWRLTGTDRGDFNISETGELTFRSTPDHERPDDSNRDNEYLFTVQASDGRYYGTLDVTVTVDPVNEPPTITTSSRSAMAMRHPENRTSRLYTYRATDPEGLDTVTWSLGGTDAGFFFIHDERGEFFFSETSPPDFETRATAGQDENYVVYNVTVQASDGTYTSTLDVTVTVTDVNEGPEISRLGSAPGSVPENQDQETVLARYAGTDPEGGTVSRWRTSGSDGGDFVMNEQGELRFRNIPDYEGPTDSNRDNTYEFTVQASDGRNYGSFEETVTVLPVNEPPTITTSSSSATAMRHPETRTSRLYTYRATDPEGLDTVTWSLGGADARFFFIHDERGEFFFSETSPPDFETRATPGQTDNFVVYNVTVQASDGTYTSTLPVTVTVTDVNEGPEVSGPATLTIAENQSLSNSAYSATDPEGLNVARWSVGGRDGGDFFITQGGTLYFRYSPDYERPADSNQDNEYELSIQPSDGRNTGSYPVTVTVTDVNEPPEIRRGSRTTFTQPENRASRLYTYSATDPERGEITWSVGGTDGSHFTIDERGQFSFDENSPPDFDSPGDEGGDNIYLVTIQARDPERNTASLPVTVIVTEVNEGPTITQVGSLFGSPSGTVQENLAQTQVLATYTALDPERPSVTVTQWSTSGRDGGDFVINALGELRFRNAPDFERSSDSNRDNVYEVTIRASDGRHTGTLEEVQVVTVTDVNEPPTITTTSRTEFTQQENRTSTLYTFRATDPERGTVTWEPTGNDGRFFTIDEGGRFSFTNEPDFDIPGDAGGDNVYNVTVRARDDRSNADNLEVTVTVTNHSEGVEPTISTRRPPTTYRENGTSTVYTFRASDPQRDTTITWTKDGTDSDDFTLIADTSGRGVLAFASPPDFESPADSNQDNEYELAVIATDDEGHSDRVDFTITVTNDNEGVEPTISTRRPPTTYRENDMRTVYTFRASDPQRDTIAWSREGTDAGDFTIIPDSSGRGVLTFNYPPDFENPVDSGQDNEYELTVVASDGNGNSDKVAFTITVSDINEGPTIRLEGTATTSVPENTADTRVLAKFTATDPENPGVGIYQWNTTGRDSGDFLIDELGELRFRNSPDYERPADSNRDNTYEVIVRAYDGRAYGTLEEPLEIMVRKVNEPPVITTKSRTEFSLRENSTSIIYTYRATDQDEDDVIRWSVEGPDGADFAIYNGILTFRLLPDFEVPVDNDENNVYEITVVAADSLGLRDTVDAAITITDQPEGPVIAGRNSFTVTENYDITQTLGTYTATDAKDGRRVYPRWSLSGRDGGDFVVDQVTGVLSFRNTPDYDSPADSNRDNVYEVTVRGHDSRAYGNLNVTVTVTNINEGTPVVTGRTANTVRENTDRAIYTYRATDSDLNTDFIWSVEGVDGGNFAINPDSGGRGVLTFSSPPDFEQPGDQNNDNVYEVTVVASDGTNRGTLDVTVTVTAQNEGPTVSGQSTYTISENRELDDNRAGASTTYTATDPEAIGGVTTTIIWSTSGRDGGDFTIDRETGVLTFRTSPDYERPADANRDNMYEVTVRAYDGRNYGNFDVTVTVEDVNEITGSATLTIPENFERILETYSAAGQGSLTVEPAWRLTGTDSGDFDIHSESGVLTFRSIPDHERPADSNLDNVYNFAVQVSDDRYYGTLDVTVTVTAVNEPPDISGRDSLSFRENTPVTTRLHTYSARDPEGDVFTWRLGGLDASDFSITTDSRGRGVVTFASPPNFDSPGGSGTDGNEYLVTMQARDAQGNTGELPVIVTVTDQNEGAKVTGQQTIAVQENRNPTLTLATYGAIDPEEQAIVRWNLSGSDGGDFLISENGALTFRNTPDYDMPADSNRDNEYLVTVRAYDGRTYGNLDVTVTVSNINEDDPVIRSVSPTSHTYREESTSALYTYSATDQDKDDVITWTTGGTDGSLFEFNDRNGLEFKEPPDYEDPGDSGGDNGYELTVIATDSGGRSASLDVTVTVTALEEGPEVTGTATYTVTEGRDLLLATFTGRDPETPAAEVTSWRLAGSDAGDFTITDTSETTGRETAELTFSNTPDYDSPADSNRDNEYLVTIRAYNGSTYGSLDVTVTVTDTNEAAPVVTGRDTLSFRENTDTDTKLYTYRATDMDRNTEIRWSVRGTDGDDFTITRNSSGRGELYFSNEPNHERAADSDGDNVYEITVVASDGSKEGTLDVTITVTEINEGPEVTGRSTRTVSENFDQVLATYSATDPEDSVVTRWSLGGSDSADFIITDSSAQGGPYTADLTFRNPPNYERPADSNGDNEYEVTVLASDGRVYGTYDVTVTVEAVDEAPEFRSGSKTTFTYRENGTSALYTYRATDPEGAEVSWSLSGTDAGDFEIDEDGGVLTFSEPPDFDEPADGDDDNEYEVTIVATDQTDHAANLDITVTVTEQNEGPIISGTAEFTVQENHEGVLGTYTARDPEDPDAEITRWSVTGRDGGDFTINEDGELSFRNPPDDERRDDSNRDNVYEVTVRASDGRYYGTFEVTVTVTPVDEAPEFRTSTKDSFSYQENGTSDLYTYRANDPEGSDISWDISGTDSGAFSISEEGVLTFNGPPDYETPTDSGEDNVYEVTVEVSDVDEDGNTVNTRRLEVTVTVTNLTD